MKLKDAKMMMDQFYDFAVYRLNRGRDYYTDGVCRTFRDKCDAIVACCIWCNNSDTVYQKAQAYKFELEDKLNEYYNKLRMSV